MSDTSFVTSHSIDLSLLSPETTYYFVVVSTDVAGNISTSTEQILLTSDSLDPVPVVPSGGGGGSYHTNFTNILSGGSVVTTSFPNILTPQTPTATPAPENTPNVIPIITNTVPPVFFFTKVQAPGNIAPEVKSSPGKENNRFGPGTKAALAKFQKDHNIKPSVGYFGPVTKAYINAMLKGMK